MIGDCRKGESHGSGHIRRGIQGSAELDLVAGQIGMIVEVTEVPVVESRIRFFCHEDGQGPMTGSQIIIRMNDSWFFLPLTLHAK